MSRFDRIEPEVMDDLPEFEIERYAPGHWDYPTRCADVEVAMVSARERVEEWIRFDQHGWWHERAHLIALYNEIVDLRRWKAEATEVLAAWDQVFVAAGEPGPLGGSKAEAVRELVNQMTPIEDRVERRCLSCQLFKLISQFPPEGWKCFGCLVDEDYQFMVGVPDGSP